MTDFHDPTPAPEMTLADASKGPPEGWGAVIAAPHDEDPEKAFVMCGWTLDGEFHQYVSTERIASAFIGYMQKVHEARDTLTGIQDSIPS